VVPTSYEIRIKGRLGEPVVSAFGGFSASVRAPETILSGAIPDQHALYQLLERIRGLGLELLEVRKLQEPDDAGSGASATG
jgi:hypothetical protein